MAVKGIKHGALGESCIHICVDMQRLFSAGYPWAVPWLERILPLVEQLCEAHPERTVFTRFIPAAKAGQGHGAWARYYRRWAECTLDRIGSVSVRLIPALERFSPPARTVDKSLYSPWMQGALDRLVVGTGIDTVIVSGGETDVCVLATVLGAVDRGFRVVLATDAFCSSSDATHDALMLLYLDRFTEQIEVATTAEILREWR